MFKKLEVSKIARGQYKQLCQMSWNKCDNNEGLLVHKIRRAVNLGNKTYEYSNGDKVIRYYYHNFLVNEDEILKMWFDRSRNPFNVSEGIKRKYSKLVTV